MNARQPISGEGHCEHFLNPSTASAVEPHTAIGNGHSVLVLTDLVLETECEVLRAAASAVASSEAAKPPTDRSRAWWSVQEVPGRMRLPIDKAPLGKPVVGLCDEVLLRVTQRLDGLLPSLLSALFGASLMDIASRATMTGNPAITFSPREPALNVYQQRGRFKPHRDEEALTIIVPLNGAGSFTGGGTAFWSTEDGRDATAASSEPSFVLTPAAGTAVVFAGCVMHAAVAVQTGERCVLVASFSPTDDP